MSRLGHNGYNSDVRGMARCRNFGHSLQQYNVRTRHRRYLQTYDLPTPEMPIIADELVPHPSCANVAFPCIREDTPETGKMCENPKLQNRCGRSCSKVTPMADSGQLGGDFGQSLPIRGHILAILGPKLADLGRLGCESNL